MGLFDRIKSAASGAIPVEDDLDMGGSQRVTNLPASANPGDAARADEVPAPSPQFYRQDTLPTDALDGATLVTDADGAGNDTNARYVFNAAADRWELDSAVGPSEPSLGTPVAGALWRDTSNGSAKQYDGSAFVKLTPTTTGEVSPNDAEENQGSLADSSGVDFASNAFDGQNNQASPAELYQTGDYIEGTWGQAYNFVTIYWSFQIDPTPTYELADSAGNTLVSDIQPAGGTSVTYELPDSYTNIRLVKTAGGDGAVNEMYAGAGIVTVDQHEHRI